MPYRAGPEAITVANVNEIVGTIQDFSQQQAPGTALINMPTGELPHAAGIRVLLPSVGYDPRTDRDKLEGEAHIFFGVEDEDVAIGGLRRAWLTIRSLDFDHMDPHTGRTSRVIWNLTYAFPILPEGYEGRPRGTVPKPPETSKFPERMTDYRPTVRLTGSRVPTGTEPTELRSAHIESLRTAGPSHEPVPELRVAPPNAPSDTYEYTAPMSGSDVRLMRQWLETLRDRPVTPEDEPDSEERVENGSLASHVSNAHYELSTVIGVNENNPLLTVVEEDYNENGSTGKRTFLLADVNTDAIPDRLLERLLDKFPNLTWYETAGVLVEFTEPDDGNIQNTTTLTLSLISKEDNLMYRVEFSLDAFYDADEDPSAIDRLPKPRIFNGSPLEDLDEVVGEQEQITIEEALQIVKLAEEMNDGTIQLRPHSL